jgi:hypothetical protein
LLVGRSPLKSGCLLALLADIARYKHLYSEKESFRKVKLAKVRQTKKHTQTNRMTDNLENRRKDLVKKQRNKEIN